MPRATIGSAALRAALVSIEISTSTFFWKIERVEGLLCAGRARGVVGDFELQLPAQDAAGGVDLLDGEFGRLHDRRRDDAVGAGQTDGHADLDRIGGERRTGEDRRSGGGGKQSRERTSEGHGSVLLRVS